MADAAAPADSGHDDHGHGEHHVHPPAYYIKIWGVLCVLLFVSVAGPAIGELMPEGLARTLLVLSTAFGIACVKAGLVIHYFMHLTLEKRVVHYFLVTSIVFMGLFIAGTAPDVNQHQGAEYPGPDGDYSTKEDNFYQWENVAAKAEIERALAAQAAGGDHHGGEHGDGHEPDAGHGTEADHGAEGGHGADDAHGDKGGEHH